MLMNIRMTGGDNTNNSWTVFNKKIRNSVKTIPFDIRQPNMSRYISYHIWQLHNIYSITCVYLNPAICTTFTKGEGGGGVRTLVINKWINVFYGQQNCESEGSGHPLPQLNCWSSRAMPQNENLAKNEFCVVVPSDTAVACEETTLERTPCWHFLSWQVPNKRQNSHSKWWFFLLVCIFWFSNIMGTVVVVVACRFAITRFSFHKLNT